jgi:hypothetical protein
VWAAGAEFVFRTGFLGEADMAAGILELAAAGCNVIVDDLYYFNEVRGAVISMLPRYVKRTQHHC